ncbi:ABC transporter ATP-binding protein [Desulfobacter vibrioformis]|uniref:ABC transporter ATP-binding protein n=1 Tax=Desulfobacter vibrioformis TaxID=34031 RepID=UPI000A04F27C|nr:ATP-binding cassette domain-containing protein [Desulfobacter vibrioformis]
MEKAYLTLHGVTKTFGPVKALDQVSFSAGKGEFLSILGPSGCGKTTALRVIAGLEHQSDGKVLINGRDVTGMPVSKRNVGIVFQSYALFPNLNAEKNIAYGLRGRFSRHQINKKVAGLMDLTGLTGMGHKFPSQLSGGQQQRVALARAMALSPDLLLLDEPLSALDARVRVRLRREIRMLQQKLGVTTIMVTHDQEEALTMADRVLVMNGGKLIQDGTPEQIYQTPATPFVASFIGSMNFFKGAARVGDYSFEVAGKTIKAPGSSQALDLGDADTATLAIRPEDIKVKKLDKAGENAFPAVLKTMEYRGHIFRLAFSLQTRGLPLVKVDVSGEAVAALGLTVDRPVHLVFPPDRVMVYGRSGLESSDWVDTDPPQAVRCHG